MTEITEEAMSKGEKSEGKGDTMKKLTLENHRDTKQRVLPPHEKRNGQAGGGIERGTNAWRRRILRKGQKGGVGNLGLQEDRPGPVRNE